jgi:hypothetical protein
MNQASTEPQYVTSLWEIFWGATLVAITMAMHGVGMLLVLRANGAMKHRVGRSPTFFSGVSILIVASWMILLVHLFEVMVWAAFFYWKGAFANASIAYYFSLNEYTTVGSNYNLPLHWRLLEGMIATAGLLTFAWSTGVLLTLAQDFQEQEMQIFRRRRAKLQPTAAPPTGHPPDEPGNG